jgi:hypothetical protein
MGPADEAGGRLLLTLRVLDDTRRHPARDRGVSQHWRDQESGSTKIEAVEHVVGVGVAERKGGQVPLRFEQAKYRRVVINGVRDIVRPGPW